MIGLILVGAAAVGAMWLYDESVMSDDDNHVKHGDTFFHGPYKRVTGKCHRCDGSGLYHGKPCRKCSGTGEFKQTTFYD